MKEFIEKLIGRLEEYKNIANNTYMNYELNVDLGRVFGVEKSIEIVNQLSEEYKDKEVLDMVQTSADYAKARLEELKHISNNGWIACSERLPSKEEIEEWATFLVTIRVHGKYDIMDFCLFGTDGKWLVSEDREVIAWKRQTPYQPKGE